MKILYDSECFMQPFGGVSRYYYNLLSNHGDLFSYEVSGKYSNNIYAPEVSKLKPFFPGSNFKGRHGLMKRINALADKRAILRENYDLFHPTYYESAVYPKEKPVVITAHDFVHERYPQYYNDPAFLQVKHQSFKRADRIIAISENTKNDLLEFYPDIPADKISVVYHCQDWPLLKEVSDEEKKRNPYLLFTGSRNYYKNFEAFLKAAAPVMIEQNISLICTGKPFTETELKLIDELGISDRCKAVFAKTNEDLQKYYNHALLFVYPSLYEGFGFPILEAFACGCPVLLSQASCFPEIAGEAGIYFNPSSVENMREVLQNTLHHSQLAHVQVQKGYERVKQFTVQKTEEETVQVYRSLVRQL